MDVIRARLSQHRNTFSLLWVGRGHTLKTSKILLLLKLFNRGVFDADNLVLLSDYLFQILYFH